MDKKGSKLTKKYQKHIKYWPKMDQKFHKIYLKAYQKLIENDEK